MASTSDELLTRIAELEAENLALRSATTEATTLASEISAPKSSIRHRAWGWSLLAAVLIVIGSVLAPVAVAASWAKAELTDTDRFVAAYAPLANDAAVQGYIAEQTVAVIAEQVDIPALTSDVIDGIIELGTGPVATRALEALKGPASEGIRSLISSTVARFVSSDAFADVWSQALRISHTQLVSALQNDPDSAVVLSGTGEIGIQLAPVIAEVKGVLVAQGLTFAEQIPAIDRTVVLAQSDAIPTVQLGYGVAVAAGAWLPWVALAFLLAGIAVARRRAVAAIWAAVGLGLGAAVLLVAFAVGRIVATAALSPALLPAGVVDVLWESVVSAMRSTAVSILVLAILVALVVWFAGPFEVSRRLRGLFRSGAAWVRDAAERRGFSTGRTGEWMYAQRVLLRVAVAVIAAAVVLFVRPLTPAVTGWTLVLAALVVGALELAQRPVIQAPAVESGDVPVVTSD